MLEGSEELNKTIDEYLRVVGRRRWWLLLPACLAALGTVGVSLWLPDLYRSETLILVEQQKVPEHYVVSNVTSDIRNRLETMTQQILSRTRLLRIIDEFGLYAKERKRLVPEELVELMRRNIEIEFVQGDPQRRDLNAFKISYSAEDPRLAQQVTNQLTSLFIEENLKAREQQSLGTTHFLGTQVEEARLELQKQEKRLGEFKLRYLGELPEQQQANLQFLSSLQMQLQIASTRLNRTREQRVYLDSLLAQYQSLAGAGGSLPGSPAAPATTLAENELARLRSERAGLLARYTSKHPDIRKIDQEIEQAEALLARIGREQKEHESGTPEEMPVPAGSPQSVTAIAQVQSQLKANQAEIDNLLSEEKRLQEEIRRYERRLNLTPVRERQLADVVRGYNLSRQNYEGLLKKKLESELATSLEKRQQGEQFRILDPPSLPVKPHRPDRQRINLIGGVLGLGLAVGLVFLVEVRDCTFHSEKDLCRLAPLPLVVGVPELLIASEQRQRRWRRRGEWLAGSSLVLAVVAAEVFAYWRG
ncbi:MAG: XrtA system polysaccharide chain length determinant [Acidobacteriota bacterium]